MKRLDRRRVTGIARRELRKICPKIQISGTIMTCASRSNPAKMTNDNDNQLR